MMPDRLRDALRRRPPELAAWAAILAEEAHLRVGNRPPAVGKVKALFELAALLGRVESVGDGFCEAWAAGEAIVVETTVRFAAAHGRGARTVPCAVVARAVGGLLHDVRFYLDPAPPRHAAGVRADPEPRPRRPPSPRRRATEAVIAGRRGRPKWTVYVQPGRRGVAPCRSVRPAS